MKTKPAAKTSLDPSRAVRDHEMERCADASKPHCPCVRGRADVVLRGFDNKWRCVSCHKVHVADVFRQSGEGDPETVSAAQQARPTDPEVARAMAERSARIGREFKRGGRFYGVPVTSEHGFVLSQESAREVQAHQRDVPRGVHESDVSYSARLIESYRRLKRRKG